MLNDSLQRQLGALASVLLVIVSIFFIVLTVSTYTKMHKPAPMQNMITVNGVGKATVAPNLSVISFGVRTENETSEGAQTANTETTNKLIEAVKAAGIDAKDIQTRNYNLYENRVWNPDTNQDEPRGWIVAQYLDIKVRDTAKVSEVLSLASRYGVTDISGPNFQLDDTSSYKEAARADAIEDAKDQAEQLAASLGVQIGDIVSYSEWEASPGYPPYPYYAERAALDSMGGGPSIQPGEQEVSLNVSITYELR